MNNKVELLAPAGDWDAFTAAVENGADAVYLGGKLFNARQFASNFDSETLKKALDYAHVRGVSIYLTMNTLVADNELEQAADFVQKAYSYGIDGIIVQDLGLASLVHSLFPDLDLHASTQMTIYNAEGVLKLEELGFKRVVLARELSLDEISDIALNTKVEIEIFVHGALCICYSGQCLMSSIIGGRSGNRGKCAQPCRLPYELTGDTCKQGNISRKGFLLSPKDICSVYELQKILQSGVKSFKIEGRMKSPEYVGTVVSTYRKYIDSLMDFNIADEAYKVEARDMKDLMQIFNRGGFSRGYLAGKTGRDMMCFEKPKNWGIYLGDTISYDRGTGILRMKLSEGLSTGDGIEVWNGDYESPGTVVSEIRVKGKRVPEAAAGEIVELSSIKGRIEKGLKVYKTSDIRLLTRIRQTYGAKFLRKVPLTGRITINRAVPVALAISDLDGNEVYIKSPVIPEDAQNRPLTKERISEQMSKTGSTPFEFKEIEVELNDNLSVSVSEINSLRREALEKLERQRADRYSRKVPADTGERIDNLLHFPGNSRKKNKEINISVMFTGYSANIDFYELDADRLYMPFRAFLDAGIKDLLSACREKGIGVFIQLPAITRGNYDRLIKEKLPGIIDMGVDGIIAGNPGTVRFLNDFHTLKIMGDYNLNIFNSLSIKEMKDMGLRGITLSPELTLKQIEGMNKPEGLEVEAIVYGRIPLMTSEYCPVGSVAGGLTSKNRCSTQCTKGSYTLKDRLGVQFPVLCDNIDCRSIILNSSILFIPDSLERLKRAGVDSIRLMIYDEKPGEVRELVRLHRAILDEGSGSVSRYSDLVETIKKRGFTKGHYFRGVQNS